MNTAVTRKVGILCVHGIGSQRRGETLSQFVDPILKDLHDSASSGEWVQVVEAYRGSDDDLKSPAYCVVDLQRLGRHVHKDCSGGPPPTIDYPIHVRCTFVESYWAERFIPPGVGELVSWLLTRGVWTMIRHFSQLTLSCRWPRASRLLGMLLAIPLAFFVQLFVLIAYATAQLPIPRIQQGVAWVLLVMTDSLGDCLVLDSPTKRAQIESGIRRDLRWLREQGCTHVAVVAHSQGAALSLYALRREPTDSIDLLVTFGSGLAKLEELRLVTKHGPIFAMLGLGIPIIAASIVLMLLGPAMSPWLRALGLVLPIGAVAGLIAWFGTPVLTAARVKELFHRDHSSESAFRRWVDCFSRRDPIPQGSIPSAELPPNRFKSMAVRNGASMVMDHTSYWSNREEFVPAINDELAGVIFGPDAAPLSRNLDRQERGRTRRFKVGWLAACRCALIATAVWCGGHFVVANWRALEDAVRAIRGAASWNLVELAREALAAAAQNLEAEGLIRIATTFGLLVGGYGIALVGWKVWIRWSLPRVYEDQFLEPAVLWRWLGFWTMTLFSFGSCWLVVRYLHQGTDPVGEWATFVASIMGVFGFATLLIPILSVTLSIALGWLIIRSWRGG